MFRHFSEQPAKATYPWRNAWCRVQEALTRPINAWSAGRPQADASIMPAVIAAVRSDEIFSYGTDRGFTDQEMLKRRR